MGELVAQAGLKQLRIAETEKYAHVTFFFNAAWRPEFPGESRILVPSPKIATYDLKPEMSAYELDQAGRRDRVRHLRFHRRQLRQHRHGPAYRRFRRRQTRGRGRSIPVSAAWPMPSCARGGALLITATTAMPR